MKPEGIMVKNIILYQPVKILAGCEVKVRKVIKIFLPKRSESEIKNARQERIKRKEKVRINAKILQTKTKSSLN